MLSSAQVAKGVEVDVAAVVEEVAGEGREVIMLEVECVVASNLLVALFLKPSVRLESLFADRFHFAAFTSFKAAEVLCIKSWRLSMPQLGMGRRWIRVAENAKLVCKSQSSGSFIVTGDQYSFSGAWASTQTSESARRSWMTVSALA